MKTTRNTPRKEAILRMLEADYDAGGMDSLAREFGRPPFPATTIAEYIDWFGGANGRPEVKWEERPDGTRTTSDPNASWHAPASVVQSFARTLRGMAKEGLLVQVREKQQTRNALAGDVVEMPRVVYHSARLMAASGVHKVNVGYVSGYKGPVIDGCISEVSPANDTSSAASSKSEWALT